MNGRCGLFLLARGCSSMTLDCNSTKEPRFSRLCVSVSAAEDSYLGLQPANEPSERDRAIELPSESTCIRGSQSTMSCKSAVKAEY